MAINNTNDPLVAYVLPSCGLTAKISRDAARPTFLSAPAPGGAAAATCAPAASARAVTCGPVSSGE